MATYTGTDPRTGKALREGTTVEMNPSIIPAQSPVQPIASNSIPTGPIPVSSLSSQPLSLAPSKPQTGAIAGQSYVQSVVKSQNDQLNAQLAQETAMAQQDVNQNKGAIASIYEKLIGQPQRREQIYREQGVDTNKKEVDRLTSEIEADQLATRRQIEALQKNPQGLFGGALNDEINRVNREALSRQADKAVLLSAANRNYSTAAEIADRKIQGELEPLQTQLDALKFFYSDNKSTLDKKESRQYDNLIKDLDRQYQEQYETKKATQQIIIEAAQSGAPTSLIEQAQRAGNPGAAARILGKYSNTYLQRQTELLQQANIRSQISERGRANGTSGLSTKPLSGGASKILSIASTLVPEVDQLNAILTGPDGRKRLLASKLGADPELDRLIDNAADKVGRLRSGGAINKDEESRFKRQIAGWGDVGYFDKNAISGALEGIRTEAQSVSAGVTGGTAAVNAVQNQTSTISNTPSIDKKTAKEMEKILKSMK